MLIDTFWMATSVLAWGCVTQREWVFLKGRTGVNGKGHFRQRPGDIAGLGQLKEADADRTYKWGAACVTQALPVLLTLGEKGARTLVSCTE